ncbi:MAG: 6-phosphogluconolactonase [Ignavibacteriales bacterium]
MNYEIKYFPSIEELSDYFAELLKTNVELKSEHFSLALSGGSTPKNIYKRLAEKYSTLIDWNKIDFYWSDERCVPPNSDESNFKMANETLFKKLSIPENNIYRIKGEENPELEAKRYSDLLESKLLDVSKKQSFDLLMLGVGEDGHTASIFPNQLYLFNESKNCAVSIHPQTFQERITLTGKVINNAKLICVIVAGRNKSNILNEIFNNKSRQNIYPIELVKPDNGKLIWLISEN